MSFLCALCGALTLGVTGSSEERVIPSRTLERLAEKVQEYYSYLSDEDYRKARRELQELQEEVESIAEDVEVKDPLKLVPEWRQILQVGYKLKKASFRVSATGSFGIRPVKLTPPLDPGVPERSLRGAFDGNLKAFLSVPRDYKKHEYPVLLVLHPIEPERGKPLKDLKSSRSIVNKVRDWLEDTYPDELLDEVIVIAPIMDFVRVSPSGLTADRPTWDSLDGMTWSITALRDIAFFNLPHDPARIFVDGHGSGAGAAMVYCARFPSVHAGAVLRGAPPGKVHFLNCRGAAMLFVGDECREFYERWSKEEGFRLKYVDELDTPALLAFLQENAKKFCPQRVELLTDELKYGSAYWLQIADFDWTLESNEPAHVIAEVNRKANEIIVTSNEKVKRFVIYLNDELLDLDKEIKVLHKLATAEEDDQSEPVVRFSGTKKRLLEEALELNFKQVHGNFGEVYVSTIEVEL